MGLPALRLSPDAQEVKLIDLGRWVCGGTPTRSESSYWGGSVPWVSPKEMKRLRLTDTSERITEQAVIDGAVVVPACSIFVVVRGMILAHSFPVCLSERPMSLNQDVRALIPNQERFDPTYVAYAISAIAGRILRNVDDSTHGTKRLPLEVLQDQRILEFPLPEQRKIAEILSVWDEAIEKLERLVKRKGDRKQRLGYELLIAGKGVADTGNWKFLKAGDLFSPRSERGFSDKPVLSVTQDLGVVRRDALDRRIQMTESDPITFKLVKRGDFVISLRSFQGGLEYSDVEGLVSPAYHVITPKIDISPCYYKHLFKSHWFIGHLATAVIGIRDGKQISFPDFASIQLPYPALREQEKIGALLDEIEFDLKATIKLSDKLKRQKQALMQRLLTGEVRVPL